ncbi:hypothetical protein VKT23_002647 [Stygiomarasmius scandens]|uniref:Uncharacterized protein n=1 Tax=Marasmiellus scandens TaxID=2682957 RepID=A0ABR1K316_9AGAR
MSCCLIQDQTFPNLRTIVHAPIRIVESASPRENQLDWIGELGAPYYRSSNVVDGIFAGGRVAKITSKSRIAMRAMPMLPAEATETMSDISRGSRASLSPYSMVSTMSTCTVSWNEQMQTQAFGV